MSGTYRVDNPMTNEALWPEPKPVLRCDDCGEGIMAEEYYYNIDGDIICDHCIDDYVRLNFRRCAECR